MAALPLGEQLELETDRLASDIAAVDRYIRTHNAGALAAVNRRIELRRSRIGELIAEINRREDVEEKEEETIECPSCGPVPESGISWRSAHLWDEPRWFATCGECGREFRPE